MTATLGPDQFAALSQLLRLRHGPAQDAARLHLVDGLPVADAAKEAGIAYKLAWTAIQRAQSGLELARKVSAKTE